MTRFRTQLNRSVAILHPRKSLKYQHIFEYRPVSFYAVDYCTDALCIKDGVKIDPCMGSGHILVYVFDVLMQIYESQGYTQRDATQSILQNNLYGLDIDERAAQLAYFAVMMKAREYDRRIFSRGIQPHVYVIVESNGLSDLWTKDNKEMQDLFDVMYDAKEYGSILTVPALNFDSLRQLAGNRVAEIHQFDLENNALKEQLPQVLALINVAEMLAKKYEIICTNPPYMPISKADAKVNAYVKKHFKDSKTDLYAVFIDRCGQMIRNNGYQAMITMHSWMFLSRSEKLRRKILSVDMVSLVHLGTRAFDDIGGEVVQTVAFILRKSSTGDYSSNFVRLVDYYGQVEKENAFFVDDNRYINSRSNFESIPGEMIIYWQSQNFVANFDNPLIGDVIEARVGLDTGNNDQYIRLWFEIGKEKILFNATCAENVTSPYKWVPHTKGGTYRKWYGNLDYIIAFDGENYGRLLNSGNHLPSRSFYFLEGITWSRISTTSFAVRYTPPGMVFNSACPTAFADKETLLYVLGLLNSKIVQTYVTALSPTMNFQAGDIDKVPCIKDNKSFSVITSIVKSCVKISLTDWNAFETSWNFQRHPLTSNYCELISDCYNAWKTECATRFVQMKANEEKLNRIFIGIYGLQDELTPEVEDKDVTVRLADKTRDVKSFLSYAVGCMFGRYSLDVDGLAYAGGEWDSSKYSSFIPDADNVIPITDEEYLEDDIVSRLCQWLKVVYGEDTLEQNLDFIASALDNKGDTSREVIRDYFLKDFFKDHCTTYSVPNSGKRPIYWLFDSGKQNGFKALIYLHRYNVDTIGNLRIDYLHRMQRIYESEINRMQDTIEHSDDPREVAQATKRKEKLQKQLKECREYDEKISHLALARIEIDLDDGVKVNYRKIQTDRGGGFHEILADSKMIMGKVK